MIRHSAALPACILALAFFTLAHADATKVSFGGAPDKAYMQKIWDAWATGDPANAAHFYARGAHVFLDIAPLKYDSACGDQWHTCTSVAALSVSSGQRPLFSQKWRMSSSCRPLVSGANR